MVFNKKFFEKAYLQDKWHYANSSYERTKYIHQIEAIKHYYPHPNNILEIGCGEGIYTLMLSRTFPGARITGVDFCSLAIRRARTNCRGQDNIIFLEADIIELMNKAGIAAQAFDVVIQSESLYYFFPRLLFRICLYRYLRAIMSTLTPDGIFLTSNGLNISNRIIMFSYYLVLRRFSDVLGDTCYRDWNETRQKYLTYDLKIFRCRAPVPRVSPKAE